MQNHSENMRVTEDLIVALLLGNSHIQKESNGLHNLVFTLEKNKQFLLDMYLERNNIDWLEIIQNSDECFTLQSSLILERIINEWTHNGVVTAIDPRFFNENMFMLWLCLFGEKTKRNVIIKHNKLAYNVQVAVINLFKEIMCTTAIYSNQYYFKISSLNEVLIGSIKNKRPSYESAELWDLLSDTAKERFDLLGVYERKKGYHAITF